MTKWINLVAPGALIVIGSLAIPRLQGLPYPFASFSLFYPYAVYAAALFLGWFFVRSRITFAVLLLAGADWALLEYAAGSAAATGRGSILFNAIALLLPLNLAAYAMVTDRGILTIKGCLGLIPIVLQAVLLWWILQPQQRELAQWLTYKVIDPEYVSWAKIGQPAIVAFVFAMVVQATRFLQKRNAIEIGYVWSLAAVFLAFSTGSGGWLSKNYLATAGLILVVALIQVSYRMAYLDELTELPGRRALNEELPRVGNRYTIAMVDVDHFKKFNDTHGHDVGDQVLRMVASRLAKVSGGGKAYRYGGEEFSVLFDGRSVDEARPHLEDLRQTIEGTVFHKRGRIRPRKKPEKPKSRPKRGKHLSVTVSIGLAERTDRHSTPEKVIKAADKALYRAKEAGRNRVED